MTGALPTIGPPGPVPLEKRARRAVIEGSTHKRAALIKVVNLGHRYERSLLVEAVRPGEIVLLQVIMPGLESSRIDGIDPRPDRIVVALGYPAEHCHAGRLSGRIPGRDIVSRVHTELNGPSIIQFNGRVDASLRVAIDREHQRMRVQVILWRQLSFNVRR